MEDEDGTGVQHVGGLDWLMSKGRCLGLIGGLGVGAAMHYYERLARVHEEQGRSLDLVMAHAETSRVFEYVEAGDREGLAGYLVSFIRRLQAAGADFAVVPAVTAHFCVQELVAISPLPLFNLFEPLNRELSARGVKRAAVFGTRFVMQAGLFGMVDGVEIIRSRQAEEDYIHDTYLELVRRGKGSEDLYRGLTGLAQTLCRRDGVDVILLAGTDLALLFNEENAEFPHVDCAALHLRAILQGMLGESSRSAEAC